MELSSIDLDPSHPVMKQTRGYEERVVSGPAKWDFERNHQLWENSCWWPNRDQTCSLSRVLDLRWLEGLFPFV